jgi:gamma-glutamylcyclotransferase
MPTRRTRGANAIGRVVTTAYVEGYRLAFDKVSTDGSGKCDIEPTGNSADRVCGVLFSVAGSEAAALDDGRRPRPRISEGRSPVVTP